MLMTDKPAGPESGAGSDTGSQSDRMLTTGEVVELIGVDGVTRRQIDRLVRDELIPFFRFGKGWLQIPEWVAWELRRRALEQIRLRQVLAGLGDQGPEADAERNRIREELVTLEGPIVGPWTGPEPPG